MEELAPGLWRWSAPHPRWRPGMDGPGGWAQEVASVAYDTGDALVLIDPQVDDWAGLDALVSGRRVVVMLGAAWHWRSTSEVIARYDAQVAGDAPGVETMPIGVDGEVLLWLPGRRALVTAEALCGGPEGLYVAESPNPSYSRPDAEVVLRRAAALPVQMVLPAHGPPALTDGAAEILRALDRPPWGTV
jgi:hypothetical protein